MKVQAQQRVASYLMSFARRLARVSVNCLNAAVNFTTPSSSSCWVSFNRSIPSWGSRSIAAYAFSVPSSRRLEGSPWSRYAFSVSSGTVFIVSGPIRVSMYFTSLNEGSLVLVLAHRSLYARAPFSRSFLNLSLTRGFSFVDRSPFNAAASPGPCGTRFPS